MPALLPPELEKYASSEDDESLLNLLNNRLNDASSFFIYAADDETWSLNHPQFMKNLFEMLTKACFDNKMELNSLQAIQKIIHEHYLSLYSYIPFDLSTEIGGSEFHLNSLLLFAAQPNFRRSIKDRKLFLKNISLEDFKIIEEFINTGNVLDLWKYEESELQDILMTVKVLGLDELQYLCEQTLKKYITRDNVLVMLIDAHKNKLTLLKDACIDSFNRLDLGVRLHKTNPSFFEFEFLDFKENAREVFEVVKSLITHLILSGDLTEQTEFAQIVNACPCLIQLNLSGSSIFNEKIFEISEKLEELDLSSCNYVDKALLNRIVTHFKNLKALALSDNIQLDYTSFTSLSKLKMLKRLDISRNPQIHDDELKLILQVLPQVIDLDCSDCKNIGDKGFFEIARSLSHLIFLNLERSQISDGLLLEIVIRSNYLEEINLSRCQRITDRGILECVKLSKALKTLVIRHCHFKEDTFKEIKEQRPSLVVIA